jgi:protoporphyrinogen oxidase
MTSTSEAEYLILGAGLAGLGAACVLGPRATVIERASRPGGLVRTECWNGYWFDHVVHLLHFSDAETEARVRGIVGPELQPCPPEAWVETRKGTTRYPFQMNLRGLSSHDAARCIADLAAVTFGPDATPPKNFEEALLFTFGRAMCEAFLFPYNEKVWKRPLDSLAAAAFQWTVTRPDFEQVLHGALGDREDFAAYNANGWYPRPGPGAAVRGMELLTRALAAKTHDLRVDTEAEEIDLDRKIVHTNRGAIRYDHLCATIPLPRIIDACRNAPETLKQACRALPVNRCVTVTASVEGPRPDAGHWRYYADPELVFSRLIFMHAFDSDSAPRHGWGALAEITDRAESTFDEAALIERVCTDMEKANALNGGTIVDAHVIVSNPAYVVFTDEADAVVRDALAFLRAHDIEPLGRFGRWEYSSMEQVLKAAFEWAEAQ